MRIELPPAERSLLLESVSWVEFQKLLDDMGEHRNRRVAYDAGRLEIMSPSQLHERIRELLGFLVHALCEETGRTCRAMGSWTLQRQDLEKSVEPDKCFYITSEAKVRGKAELDLSRDPPPDLVLEVEITRKSLRRFPIYAALGVPEIWRFTKGAIEVHRLGEDGDYATSDTSAAFPGLRIAEISRFLALRDSLNDSDIVKSFRTWVRSELKRG